MIEDNLLGISKIIFQNRKEWVNVSDEQKEKYFFIFNRFFSRKYPDLSYLINLKTMNKSEGMDLWFYFMEDKPYPKWFWSKKSKKDKTYLNPEIKSLMEMYDVFKDSDIEYLLVNFPDEINKELKLKSKKI